MPDFDSAYMRESMIYQTGATLNKENIYLNTMSLLTLK